MERRVLDTPPTHESLNGRFTNQYGSPIDTVCTFNTNYSYRDLVKKTQNHITGIKITQRIFYHDYVREGLGVLSNGDEVYINDIVDAGIERHFRFTDDIKNYPESIQEYMREHNFESIFYFKDTENLYDIGDYWIYLEDPGHSDYGEYTLCIETKAIYYVYNIEQYTLRKELGNLRKQLYDLKNLKDSNEEKESLEKIVKQKETEFDNVIPIGYAYYRDLIIDRKNW